METKQIFLNYLFGEITPITYVAAFIFLFFGLVIKWYIQINKAVKTNENTPSEFSLSYWFAHNFFKSMFSLFANVIIAFVALRFSSEIFNIPLSMFLALTLGICFDFVIDKISQLQSKLK